MSSKQPADSEPLIPPPAQPLDRHEPLPWQRPKPVEDDAGSPARLRAILESPSYCQSDQDVDFLQLEETRGVRLQIDYAKPEMLLKKHGITHTIVVFGSTRINEPAAAQRAVEERRAACAEDPADPERQRRLRIAERILAKSRYYDVAREFGQLVARADRGEHGSHLVVLTGGGPGIMEAANRGAFDAGAKSVGLNIRLPHEQYPNPYITPDLCMRFHYFALRKLHFLLRARALVAFPGGYGTMDELFETLTLVQTRKIRPVPVVLVGREFWQGAFDPDFLVDEGVIDPEDRELFWYAETAEEIWSGIRRWYAVNGESLV
ncbi:MAG: TIGR00730 family Rossman fold protein [Chromatiales bacterium]|nr:TIGR00730 family Rossman fold protein [Chromatiales bacterium]